MISHYNQIKENLSWIKGKLGNFHPSPMVQKIYATPFYIAASMRAPGKTYWLYLGRGQGHEGIWLADIPPISDWRVNDQLLEFFRKRLSSGHVLDIHLDPLDRLIHLDYHKWGQINSISYYWQGRLAYLGACYWDSDKQGFKIYLSWDSRKPETKAVYSSRQEAWDIYKIQWNGLGLQDMKENDQKLVLPQISIDEELIKIHRLDKISPTVKRNQKSKDRKLELFKKDLARVEQIHLIKNFLAKNEFIDDTLTIGDHYFKFNAEMKEFQRRDLMFQKIKRLQAAAKIIQEKMQRLEEGTDDNKVSKKPVVKNITLTKSIFPVSHLRGEKTQIENFPKDAEVKRHEDYKIYEGKFVNLAVGLSAVGNDRMRKEWASKEDWWFHSAKGTSPHIILKFKNNQNAILKPEILQLVGSCLAEATQATEVDLIYTKVSMLKGVKGTPGKVTYKGEKHFRCYSDQNWKNLI